MKGLTLKTAVIAGALLTIFLTSITFASSANRIRHKVISSGNGAKCLGCHQTTTGQPDECPRNSHKNFGLPR